MENKTAGTLEEILTGIEQRANAATPGPWVYGPSPVQPDKFWVREEGQFGIGEHICFVHYGNTKDKNEARASFIASARADVPKLVKALNRALEEMAVLGAMSGEKHHVERCAQELAAILTGSAGGSSVLEPNAGGAPLLSQNPAAVPPGERESEAVKE